MLNAAPRSPRKLSGPRFMTQFSRIFRSEPLLFVLWANELVRLVWSPPELQAASGWLMIVYVAMSMTRLRRGT
ncbi:MAG: hypothetical protein ACI9MU_003832, partial [Alphaproteobacteria bacterium]